MTQTELLREDEEQYIKSMKRISNKLNNNANRRSFIPLLLMLFGILQIMDRLTSRIKAMHQEIPDMRYQGYDMYALKEFLDSIGTIGRDDFIKNLYVDFIFILLFTLFTSLFIIYLVRKADTHFSWEYLIFFPLFRGLLDIGENIMLLFICMHYPTKYPMLASICSVVTITKFIVLGSMVILILLLCIIILVKQLHRKWR